MAKYEFKVGDRVQFKEWDEMGKEFGFCTDGDINTMCLFREEMRHLCGTYATIADLIPFAGHYLVILCNFTTTGDTCWNITPDMLKPASTKKRVDEPKKLETTYPTITAHVIEGNKTTVMLSDGRIGEVTCYHKDTFDPTVGVAEAYKKALGINKAEDKPIVKEVKRPANIGEYVKVVDAKLNLGYQNGDILKVRIKNPHTIMAHKKCGDVAVWHSEYVVLEGYDPDIHGKI